MKEFESSELIVNKDNTVYHLRVNGDMIADTVITVGDPNRVDRVSAHFDRIDIKVVNREFVTHTGVYGGKELTVMSTGIGTDNIDIFMNELDAAVNIDLRNSKLKEKRRRLNIVRIGTSGSIHSSIDVGDIIFSKYAIGMDGLAYHYNYIFIDQERVILDDFRSKISWPRNLPLPYVVAADQSLLNNLAKDKKKVVTITSNGFYGPQARRVRLDSELSRMKSQLFDKSIAGYLLGNFEMETAGLYCLSNLLGHNCCSCSIILANRLTGQFSNQPKDLEGELIANMLETLKNIR